MTTTQTPKAAKSDARACTRCGHRSDKHTAGVTQACTDGYCECRWFAVDPRTGR